jgi:hypothetical protein
MGSALAYTQILGVLLVVEFGPDVSDAAEIGTGGLV